MALTPSETFVTLVIGDIDEVAYVCDSFGKHERNRIKKGVNEHGLVRIEPDSTCTHNCGSGVIAIKIRANNSGPHFITKRKMDGSIRIDAQVETPKHDRADISAANRLVVCTLDTIQKIKELLEIDNFQFLDWNSNENEETTQRLCNIFVDANGVDIKLA